MIAFPRGYGIVARLQISPIRPGCQRNSSGIRFFAFRRFRPDLFRAGAEPGYSTGSLVGKAGTGRAAPSRFRRRRGFRIIERAKIVQNTQSGRSALLKSKRNHDSELDAHGAEDPDLDTTCINTIRTLAMDAVQQANSGHPGTPDGPGPGGLLRSGRTSCRFDPTDPIWPNRDRFVLSAGHASMLLYSMLHLTGVKAVNTDVRADWASRPSRSTTIKKFRQLAQPDARATPSTAGPRGVETTTGPLGQGAGQQRRHGDGRPLAGRALQQARLRRLFDFNVYAICGDGDMMEGISGEAASLAGHLKLSNLCWIYDNNHITIEGKTDLAFSEDVGDAVPGLRLERHCASATPTTSDHARAGLPDVPRRRPTGRR